ncbi:MAG: hypothetical protein MJ132_01750 [Clostridia bacterium]|nr:hypothetical protein [Clostridia bacterium]
MKKKTAIIITVAALVVIAAILLAVLHPWSSKPAANPPKKDKPTQQISFENLIGQKIQGLTVIDAKNLGGIFVEDGKDEAVDSVFTLTFENRTNKTLQYAEVNLIGGDETYTFAFSTLPPEASVVVQEKNRKTCNRSGEWSVAQNPVVLWFQAEPSMNERLFAVTGNSGSIEIKNLTTADIGGPVRVYYKMWDGSRYIGGITYTATADGTLAAGQARNVYAAHFVPEKCRLMFLSYGS